MLLKKETSWSRVYKNIDVDTTALANEIVDILESIGLSATFKEKGLLRKHVVLQFSKKGKLISKVSGQITFEPKKNIFRVEMKFSHLLAGEYYDYLRELWENMDNLVAKHGIKRKTLIALEPTKQVAAQQAPPQTAPVQQVSVVIPTIQPPQQQQPQTQTKCPYCGAIITQPAKFCPNCGAALQ